MQEPRRSGPVHFPLDHVAIAVESIATSLPIYESLLGAAGSPVERVESQGVAVTFIGTGPGRLELIEPTGPDTAVGRFLSRRGAGLHHVAYRVPDIEAALARFAADGFEPIDPTPRPGAHGHRVAFLNPRSTGGVLIELVSD
ncbi:MAG: methylmalonyl-CoA epimerase [Gemmatimonadetes bacterium]|nr:methylmalonyl-CoA epimerase [Gemmatimonadota bacterium]